MPGISIHVVDVSRGVVASGMKIELYGPERRLIVSGVANAKGLLEVDATVSAGAYEAVLHVGSWYREQRVSLPAVPFLDEVHYRFGISDPKQHYHLPFKCTPWGYSCFRGGA
ncbi:MAG TPA: hydroxyisourate hydrolase [Burkholderiales bacterium]|nr:hydroxyisourate hydrolase [Burkholderiales bacterium]